MELTEKQIDYRDEIFSYLNEEKKRWEAKIDTLEEKEELWKYIPKYERLIDSIDNFLGTPWNKEDFTLLVKNYRNYDKF